MALPRSRRHEVYGDMGGNYSWTLTDVGKRDAYSAVALMFAPQEPHRRSLLHCDYLVSLVHFRSLADSIGQAEFNRRITAFGVDRIRLWALAYFDLHQTVEDTVAGRRVSRPGIDSLQRIAPSSERDLVLGDHVVFFNHLAYDLLNVGIGNAWRLENAVLVRRTSQGDVFEGHGSGTLTAAQMRTRLAQEFNTVVRTVRSSTRAATSRDPRTAAEARARLAQNTYLVQRPDGWHVAGQAMLCTATHVDMPVREIRAGEVIGLHNPCDPAQMHLVERPIESARGTP
jgi:hypothetical protein